MASGARTGISDKKYDLVSVLYHAAQSAETIDQYIEDAEQAGDRELAAFFREVKAQDAERAQRARVLLRDRLAEQAGTRGDGRGGGGRGGGERRPKDVVDEASMESFPASDAPAY